MSSSVGKSNLPQKTKEEIKAEREAKKAAKAAAKAAKINSTKTVDVKVETIVANCKIPVRDVEAAVAMEIGSKIVETPYILRLENEYATANCARLEKSTKAEVSTNAAGSQPDREPSKESAIQYSHVRYKKQESESKSEGKSKAELRAERRAKQEAQRAAKQQQPAKGNLRSEESVKPRIVAVTERSVTKRVLKNAAREEDVHTVNLFKHLYQERERSLFNIAIVNSNIHPAIVRLGVQYANKVVIGSNARCVALLAAVKQVVQDFEKPKQEDFIRGLEANLKESLKYLRHCRPLGVSMQNAMRHLTWQMTRFPSTLSDEKVIL